MCGLFINSPSILRNLASTGEIITTHNKMSDIFDAHYQSGLGFENAIDISIKRKRELRDYAKIFNFDIVSGNNLKL